MGTYLLSGLLVVCWIAALATLLVFLESWFAISGRNRFVARRASGAYGVVSVFLPMRGSVPKIDRMIRSIMGQTYPFIELFLIYAEDDAGHARLAQEFRSVRSHILVHAVPVPHSLNTLCDRVRALEQTQPAAKGRWYVVADSEIVLDRLAIEASLEFAGTGEVSALSLRPGIQCTSLLLRLLAPSMEYLMQMIRVVERRRERTKKMNLDAAYLLMNREAFEVVNRMNRMPGILNEAGWNVWSYQVEGLRTFEGDGSRWMWREVRMGSWSSAEDMESPYTRRSAGLVMASTFVALIPVAGLAYGFSGRMDSFLEASIVAVSAVSYVLMAISYYLYARRLHASAWFAPLWFLPHAPASILTFLDIRRTVNGATTRRSDVVHKAEKL